MPHGTDGPGAPPPATAAGGGRAAPARGRWLTPAVLLLGWISLLTDTASEAIYPLLPLFLVRQLGARPLALGLVEGVAEAVASLLKVASGWLADRWHRRRALVTAGYGLSSAVRPLVALANGWGHVLAVRVADRVGKGVRGAPRDAMLASQAPLHARGRVYGFHRAMDHTGAVAGPLLASAYLWWRPGALRELFLLTIVPGAGVVALCARLPRDHSPSRTGGPVSSARARDAAPPDGVAVASTNLQGPSRLPPALWRLMAVLAVFALGNSTDAYLLLRLSALGVAPAAIPLLWAALHVVKASTSMFGGALADRFGRRPVITAGWLVYALVYGGFALTTSAAVTGALFVAYGVYFGLTEGVEKAFVADLSSPGQRGTAFGVYHAVVGLGALAASVLFGVVWEALGPGAAFHVGAVLAVVAVGLLWTVADVPPPRPQPRVS